MGQLLIRCQIESGYFWLSSQQQHYPHRKAVWANRIFILGPDNTDWSSELLKFRDFVRFSQNYFTQISRMIFWKIQLPIPNLRERDIDWGAYTVVWDTNRSNWPRSPTSTQLPHANWAGGSYRGINYANYPLPPYISLRYERMCGISGRRHFGYLRCVESQFCQSGTRYWGERLPFSVHPNYQNSAFQSQILEPLIRSGMGVWHSKSSPIREVVFSHRDGRTILYPVSGYSVSGITPSSRNFCLRV